VNIESFSEALNKRIAKYDLLCHPFYKSWSLGELKRDEIKDYASHYYHHVNEFPNYLDTLLNRLPAGELRDIVSENKADEEGVQSRDGRSHADIWMDFAEGMGANPAEFLNHKPLAEIQMLIDAFKNVVENGTTVEALASLYAYESQVPRVATEKERGLKEQYGADDRTAYYFTLHKTFDIMHSKIWLEQLTKEVGTDQAAQESALGAAGAAALSLWVALDGVERQRLSVAKGGAAVNLHN
jgi:pyrroloquinoline-quinone synthase